MLVHSCLFLFISSGYSARRNIGLSHLGTLEAQVGKSILNSSDDAPQWWDDAMADLRLRFAKAQRTISPKTPAWWSRFTTGVRSSWASLSSKNQGSAKDPALKIGATPPVVNAAQPQPEPKGFIGKVWASMSKAPSQRTESTPDPELAVGAPVAVVNAAQPQPEPKSFSLPMKECSAPPENCKVIVQISNAFGIGIMVNFYSTSKELQSQEGVKGMRMLGSFVSEVSAEEIPQKDPIPIIEKDITNAHRLVFSDKGKYFNLGRMRLRLDYATLMLFIDKTFDPEKYYAKSDERYLKEDTAEYKSAQSHHNSFVGMLSLTEETSDAEGVMHYNFRLDPNILENGRA